MAKRLHPQLASWFHKNSVEVTEGRLLAIPSILKRESVIITAISRPPVADF
ncbi:MAG TPA: hypothetical protein VE086_04680 [Chthoniobacterales bacterium]|nr:hypothetical protein [Chthoniobacterales bacterium]